MKQELCSLGKAHKPIIIGLKTNVTRNAQRLGKAKAEPGGKVAEDSLQHRAAHR